MMYPPDASDEDRSPVSVVAQEPVLPLSDSVQEMLKLEDARVSDVVPVSFSTYKIARSAKVFFLSCIFLQFFLQGLGFLPL